MLTYLDAECIWCVSTTHYAPCIHLLPNPNPGASSHKTLQKFKYWSTLYVAVASGLVPPSSALCKKLIRVAVGVRFAQLCFGVKIKICGLLWYEHFFLPLEQLKFEVF